MSFNVQTPSIPDMELCGLRTACHLRMLWKKGEMDQQKNKSVEPMKSRQKMCTHCGWNKCRLRIFGSGLLTFGCNVGDESGSNQVNWLFECVPLKLCLWTKRW